MTAGKSARPKLVELSLHRDIYSEVCAELGFDPLPTPRPIADILRNVTRTYATGGVL